MAQQTVIGSGSTRNNGGTILHGGNIASTRWDNFSLIANNDTRKYSTLIPAATAHMVKPYSAGNYGKMVANQYVVRRMGTYIAGQSNTVLLSGASSFFRFPIKPLEGTRRLHITAWNAVTGAPTYGGNRGDAYSFHAIDSGSVVDQAAHPSRAVPGELVYLRGGLIPYMDDYKAITLA